MKDIRVREMISRPYNESQKATTFIELCFKYEGLPESRDSTRLKTVTPEDAAMEDAEAKGTYISGFHLERATLTPKPT